MNNTINIGVSALKSFAKGIETIGDNIANVNSTAHKSSRLEYSENFVETLERSSAAPGNGNQPLGSARLQLGGGVQIDAVSQDFSQGAIKTTGFATDLALEGRGFFHVKEVDTAGGATGNEFYTRAGNFRLDQTGFLVTTDGFRVQQIGGADINLAYTANDGRTLEAVDIDLNGQVRLMLSDGTIDTTRGIIQVSDFRDSQGLVKQGKGYFENDSNDSAGLITEFNQAGLGGLGKVRARSLEQSNVDLTEQFAEMITTQRSFQAGARIITTADQLLTEAVNLKR